MGWLPFSAQQLWNFNNIILPSWFMIGYNAKSELTTKITSISSVALACVYASIVLPSMINPPKDGPPMDFFSLQGVVNLFKNSNDEGILAAWIHYVIFDMWTARWIGRDYEDNVEFNYATKAYELVCLFFTMMLGPVGLGMYLVGKYTFLPIANNKKLKDV